MNVTFHPRANGPERLAAEVEVHFDEGPMHGLKLVGFAIWLGADGERYVTFPSRAFGGGTERKFFDYLRSADGSAEVVRGFKAWILNAYRVHLGEVGQ